LTASGRVRPGFSTTGGVKDSGWGRSGSHSMADFTELQWVTTREGTGGYPI
jgi:acyl-CoA reductase-like NAD-dependent aldehyde dehydrogenase